MEAGGGQSEREIASSLVQAISSSAALLGRKVSLMEVCGTHTVELRRHGVHSLLPKNVRLVSGPGCPVCVTPAGYIDNALAVARSGRAVVASFGDMLRVPGSDGETLSSLARTGSVKLVYSPSELPPLASRSKVPVMFLAVGFETTIPTILAALSAARRQGIDSLLLYTAFKTIVPALRFLLARGGTRLDAFLLPGHVSAVIGAAAYDFLRKEGGIPGVVTGFEPLDLLLGIHLALRQAAEGRHDVENAYTRVVKPAGNPRALALMAEYLEPGSEAWRGLGRIEGASLGLRREHSRFDARERFGLAESAGSESPGCLCARVIAGEADPPECGHFGGRCTPDDPVGPCMVSSEGTCAAWLRWGDSTA